MSIGIKILKLRKERKMSQPELAYQLGISQTALCEIESGKTKKVDFLLLDKICQHFAVDFDYFLEKPSLKQVNKDSAVGYLAESQTFNFPEKLIEQYECRLKEKDEQMALLKERIKDLSGK